MSYLDMALGVKEDRPGDLYDLIQGVIQEIDDTYRPGLVGWIKGQPIRWEELLLLENTINKAAYGEDEAGLKAALEEYRDFFKEMGLLYQKAEEMPLFGKGEQ